MNTGGAIHIAHASMFSTSACLPTVTAAEAGGGAGAWLGAGRCSRMVSTAVTARWCGSEEGR